MLYVHTYNLGVALVVSKDKIYLGNFVCTAAYKIWQPFRQRNVVFMFVISIILWEGANLYNFRHYAEKVGRMLNFTGYANVENCMFLTL